MAAPVIALLALQVPAIFLEAVESPHGGAENLSSSGSRGDGLSIPDSDVQDLGSNDARELLEESDDGDNSVCLFKLLTRSLAFKLL